MYKILFSLFMCAWLAVPALAAPAREMTLYPDGADVRESGVAVREDEWIEWVLPEDAQNETLRVVVKDARVAELTINPVLRPESPRIATLRNRWKEATREAAEMESRLAGLHSRLAMWQTPPVKADSATTLREVEQSIDERVSPLHAESTALTGRLSVLREEIDWLARELQRRTRGGISGAPGSLPLAERGVAAKVARIRVVPVAGGAALPAEVTVDVAYRLGNCGWEPRTVLEALPEEGQVRVRREAGIIQRTGQDWEGVNLHLSTVRPSASPVSDEPPVWRIAPQSDALPVMARASNLALPAQKPGVEAKMAAPSMDSIDVYGPAHFEDATGAVWSLGNSTVLSGEPLLISLDEQVWKGEFTRLLRPAVRKTAWLMAAVTAPTPQQFSGGATVYVNGQFVGDMPFSFSGLTGNIAFGDDPAVTVTSVLDANRSGESGLISKSRTRVWAWTIKARNGHTFPVKVRIEDAAPQAGDERIAISVDSSPKAQLEGRTLRWALELKPGEESQIRHTVKYEAPEGLQIHSGR